MRRWVLVAVLGGAVLLGGVVWLSRDCDRAASSGNSAGPVVTGPAGAEYWTPERMASARPAEMPVGRAPAC